MLIGLWNDGRTRYFAAPMLAGVCVFSLLGHKEWRFILPAVPMLSLAAASTAVSLVSRSLGLLKGSNRAPRRWMTMWLARAAVAGLAAGLTAQFASHALRVHVSAANYPGAEAMWKLHRIERSFANGKCYDPRLDAPCTSSRSP